MKTFLVPEIDNVFDIEDDLFCIGVNHPAIVREIPHFDVFPAFLLERPAFLAEFREEIII